MRVLLFTGKGGVGKTSVAAATAVRAAGAGLRTLVLSTDPAHSLADVLDTPLADEPTEVAPRLEAEQLDARRRLEESWQDIQAYLVELLAWGGTDAVAAEELSLLPGLEELFALSDLRRHADDGAHDLLVVDCAPTAETLRLLSLPSALGWYLDRIFPVQRRLAGVVRPVLGRVSSMPLPSDDVFDAVQRLHTTLAGIRALLSDGAVSTVRLVVNPEAMVMAEAQRTYTALCLFGYHVDAVVVNRLLPAEVTDPYFDRWKALQRRQLAAAQERFAGLPQLQAPLLADEPIGVDALAGLGAVLYAAHDPAAVLCRSDLLRIERDGDGYVLRLALPLVERAEVDLLRRGDELYVKVGAHTRSLVLPATLRRATVTGARLDGERLEVRFGGGARRDDGPGTGAPPGSSRPVRAP